MGEITLDIFGKHVQKLLWNENPTSLLWTFMGQTTLAMFSLNHDHYNTDYDHA